MAPVVSAWRYMQAESVIKDQTPFGQIQQSKTDPVSGDQHPAWGQCVHG